jgi:hypothetical protein
MRAQRVGGRFSRGWLLQGMMVASACAAVTSSGCGKEERGQLTLAFTTDMDVPRDVNRVVLNIRPIGGGLPLLNDPPYIIEKNANGSYASRLPGTLAVFLPEGDPRSVRIQVGLVLAPNKVLGVREVVAEVPTISPGQKLVRMPITWLSGYAAANRGAALGEVDAIIDSKCPDGTVPTSQGCTRIEEDPATPDEPSKPETAAIISSIGQPTKCFPASRCFQQAVAVKAEDAVISLADGGCYLLLGNPVDDVSLAFSSTATAPLPQAGFELEGDFKEVGRKPKIIVLERSGTVDGWKTESIVVSKLKLSDNPSQIAATFRRRYKETDRVDLPQLPPTLCAAIRNKHVDYLFASAACAPPGPTTQMCTDANRTPEATEPSGDAKNISKDEEIRRAFGARLP